MGNAYKHLYTRASCSIASGGTIETVAFRGNTIEHAWDESDCAGQIIIRHRDERTSIFSTSIEAVVNMWTTIIEEPDQAAVWGEAAFRTG
jgi:hypothetical protein